VTNPSVARGNYRAPPVQWTVVSSCSPVDADGDFSAACEMGGIEGARVRCCGLVASAYGAGTALPGSTTAAAVVTFGSGGACPHSPRGRHVPLDAPTPAGRRKAL